MFSVVSGFPWLVSYSPVKVQKQQCQQQVDAAPLANIKISAIAMGATGGHLLLLIQFLLVYQLGDAKPSAGTDVSVAGALLPLEGGAVAVLPKGPPRHKRDNTKEIDSSKDVLGMFIPSVYNVPAPAAEAQAGKAQPPEGDTAPTELKTVSAYNSDPTSYSSYSAPPRPAFEYSSPGPGYEPYPPPGPGSSYGYLNETAYGAPPTPPPPSPSPGPSIEYGYGYASYGAPPSPDYGYGPPLPYENTTRSLTTELECLNGFDTLVQDLGLFSIILSVVGLVFGIVSLIISNWYNVMGSALSLLFVGLPSAVISVLNLLGAGPPSASPIVVTLTIKSIVDAVNNMFSVVPGSLFSDSLALISILIGKVSLAIGFLSSYPTVLERLLTKWGIKEFVDKNYACQSLKLGAFVQDWFYGTKYESTPP